MRLNLDQLAPSAPDALRQAHRARLVRMQGKGNNERTVFLSADARVALADYLERRLGHRSQRYIHRYTNPPAEVAAAYVEGF